MRRLIPLFHSSQVWKRLWLAVRLFNVDYNSSTTPTMFFFSISNNLLINDSSIPQQLQLSSLSRDYEQTIKTENLHSRRRWTSVELITHAASL
ncbi:hypothetical protein AQUCO_03100026v1 [Aquilegia coerulea]|uniref:Uncharacterized protein n=1 Tax=Aquilegia coerulea TaxID=218851 RepID=A0A2G5D0E0_AQUCA|nr:hypothetical protein AQUCO_03100026v1 [Aquilegia coerulea]